MSEDKQGDQGENPSTRWPRVILWISILAVVLVSGTVWGDYDTTVVVLLAVAVPLLLTLKSGAR